MTEEGGWEPVETAASAPRRAAPLTGRRTGGVALRMHRSRRPALAALDGGGEIMQRRLRDVMVGATVILVPAVALNIWVAILGYDRVDPNDSSIPAIFDDTSSGIEDLAVLVAAVFVSITTAVVGFFAAQILLGERFRTPVSVGRALIFTLRRLPAIVAAWALTHWWFPLMALIVVTSNPETAGLWLFFFVFVAWFSSAATLLVVPTMASERLGPLAAALRSWRLVKLRYGLCLVFVLAATVVSTLLLIGIATLVPLLEQFGFLEFGQATWLVQSVMVQIAVLVVVPLVALATAQAYLEVRLGGEGLDLEIDADAAFGPAVESGSRR